jgi:hypothetical protein
MSDWSIYNKSVDTEFRTYFINMHGNCLLQGSPLLGLLHSPEDEGQRNVG